MEKEKNIKLLKQLANDIAKNKNKWSIMKEINNMLEGHYDKYHFSGILARYDILKPEYFEIIEELENRELLLTLRKYIREIILNKS
jgi:predicted molibdopterin-dependent oxidoreductase YjgC